MLDHAPGCAGPDRAERSQRYAAATISACRGDGKDTMDGLNALAMNWFAHFLWIFRMHGSYKKYSSSADPSGAATPTLVETSGFMFEEPGSRPSTTSKQVMKSQKWTCPITGVREDKHWDALAEDPDVLLSVTETCHIL
ncbi:hypothetical protein ARMSODRAFT_1025632 [Armillaria solidipes]|uniref:Uncharacterized protein n=1 Tax=Armillaria solidipes TaxID=1076256 RepID=A0A2H3B370_9AGAR|nr:hypothetical protein ARMSODRAFT_1025632 [Armillaria solidipes]